MGQRRVTYTGPPALAMRVAEALADADGIELTSSEPPRRDEAGDAVVLALTVDGTPDAVAAAVEAVEELLPTGASLAVDSAPTA